MQYNIDFDICAIIITALTLTLYFMSKKLKSLQEKIFTIAGFDILIINILDITASLLNGKTDSSVLLCLNLLYQVMLHILPCIMFFYIVVVIGQSAWTRGKRLILIFIPYLIELILLCLSPLTKMIFFVDNGWYYQGNYYFLIYLGALFYIVGSLLALIYYKENLSVRQLTACLSYMILQLTAVAIQYFFPQLLLVGIAAAFTLLIQYIALQSAVEYTDSLTTAYNKTALNLLIDEAYRENEEFYILGYSLCGFNQMCLLYGESCGNGFLRYLNDVLSTVFNSPIIRLEDEEFGVFITDNLDSDRILQLTERIPETWSYRNYELAIKGRKVLLYSGDFTSKRIIMELLEFAFNYGKEHGREIIIVDEAINRLYSRREQVLTAVQKAIADNTIDVVFQPIVEANTTKVVAVEALARLNDPLVGNISPSEFIPIAEKGGLIMDLSVSIRAKVWAFLQKYDIKAAGIEHVSINLSAVEATQKSLTKIILQEQNQAGIESSLVNFEITETAAVSSLTELAENMRILQSNGFAFHLDDYGTGYSTLLNLITLPFSVIKIDKSLLALAEDAERGLLIKRMIAPFHDYGVKVVCEGIETFSQVQLVSDWQVDYFQGFYYSVPLTSDELVAYVQIAENQR